MKILLCLVLCLAVALHAEEVDDHTLILDYLLDYNGGNYFDHCKVLQVGNSNGGQGFVLAWKVNANSTVTFGISAYTKGWVALGYSPSGSMIVSDATMNWVDDDTRTVHTLDYYLSLRPADGPNNCPGVCPDTAAATQTTDDITPIAGNQNDTTSVSSFIFTRPFNTGDATNDPQILNPNTPQRYIAAYHPGDPRIAQHTSRYQVQLTLNDPTLCPNNCTGQGVCHYGCCYCNPGKGGNDCSVTIKNGPNGDLTPEFVESDYKFSTEFSGKDFVVYWKVEDDVIEYAIRARTKGWVAFGPTKSGGMLNSDVVVGWIDDAGVPSAFDYYITERSGSCPGVCKDDNSNLGGTNDLLAFNGNFKDGITTIKYRKKMDTGDSISDIKIIDGNMDVVWGYHPDTPGPGIAQHGTNTKGQAKVNFLTGASKLVNKKALRQAHGYLMFFGWAVFVPIGSFIARFFKRFPWWFNVHRVINGFAMLMTTAAFIIAVIMVEKDAQFTEDHHIIGLVITILGTAQPVLGLLADKLFNPDRERAPIFPDIIHWIIGWSSYLLAFVNIILGLILYESPQALIIIYFIGGLLSILFIAAFTIYRLIKPDQGH